MRSEEWKTYVSNDHKTHWLGAASVAVARSELDARVMIERALKADGLGGGAFTVREITPDNVEVLCNGTK